MRSVISKWPVNSCVTSLRVKKFQPEGFIMRCKSLFVAMFGILIVAQGLWAQAPQAAREEAPWRGAGPKPGMGPPDVGAYKCPPAPEGVAVPAGPLFDNKSGQMLPNPVMLPRG